MGYLPYLDVGTSDGQKAGPSAGGLLGSAKEVLPLEFRRGFCSLGQLR